MKFVIQCQGRPAPLANPAYWSTKQSSAWYHVRAYINEMCLPLATVPILPALRFATRGDLVVLRKRLKLGNRALRVTGPVA